jgi:LPXTG-motif cell wall-anchored protein
MDVRVRFAWAGRNDAMLRRLPLDFEVRLVQAGSSEGNPGDLPGTGSAVSRWLLLLAGALVGAGAGLVAGVRRHG